MYICQTITNTNDMTDKESIDQAIVALDVLFERDFENTEIETLGIDWALIRACHENLKNVISKYTVPKSNV